jgi:phosphatidylglycerophosphate synthase
MSAHTPARPRDEQPAERGIPPLAEVRRITQKKRDAWWTVLLVDPLATPLVRWTARHTRLTPNQITWAALVLGLGAAACFERADWRWLIAGAVLYHLSFVLDCMDGKLARLTGTGTVFGSWLDYVFDRIRVLACAIALMGGQYERTGRVVYLWLALAVAFLDMLRYVDALQIFKIRHGMRKQIKTRVRAIRRARRRAALLAEAATAPDASPELLAAAAAAAEAVRADDEEDDAGLAFMEDLLRENPEADIEQDENRAETGTPGTAGHTGGDLTAADEEATDADGDPLPPAKPAAVVDLHQEFRHRFPWYARFRTFLLSHRIRTHLVSGIEFQMGVFIVGPLADRIIGVTVGSAALLLVFELAIIYKLLLSTRDFGRTMASFGPVPDVPRLAGLLPGQEDGVEAEDGAEAEERALAALPGVPAVPAEPDSAAAPA